MLELMLAVPENAEIHPAFSAHRSMLNELNTKTNMHSYRISVFARVSSCCIYSIFYNEERDLWDENLLCHSSLCGAVFPDSPKLSHCEPSAHPFVHQHVYSWHNSHCGTSRSCRRKSGRVLCISKLTTCQRQTHKRIIWKRRWGGGFKFNCCTALGTLIEMNTGGFTPGSPFTSPRPWWRLVRRTFPRNKQSVLHRWFTERRAGA